MTGLPGGVLNLATPSPPEKHAKSNPIARKIGGAFGLPTVFHGLLQVFESIAGLHPWPVVLQNVFREVFSDVQPSFTSTPEHSHCFHENNFKATGRR
jgi:hypothetical protein